MKITAIQTFIPRVPLGKEQFYSSQSAFPERNSLLVKVETDSGHVGWGEGGHWGPPEPVAACINHVFAPQLVGQDPRSPVRIWEEHYARTRDFGQKGTYIEAISALDIALWDIFGQAVGEPVHRLLGGAFRDRIHAYATGCYYRGEDILDHRASESKLIDEVRSYVDDGFEILKIKIGLLSVRADVERIVAIKKAVGDDIRLLIDANHAYNASTAIQMGQALAGLDIGWFEEPVPPEDRAGYRRVRQAITIPIAGGECEFTRFGFRDFIGEGCVDIIQPDLGASGGFSEWVKIHALASANGVPLIPHVWGSGIALAAALHVTAATPQFPYTANPLPLTNEPVIEFDRNHNPLRDDLLEENMTLIDGCLPVPQGPGLGVTVRPEILERYADKPS